MYSLKLALPESEPASSTPSASLKASKKQEETRAVAIGKEKGVYEVEPISA